MPTKPRSLCKSPLCRNRTQRGMNGYCPDHYRQHNKAIDELRGSSYARGYDKRWQAIRKSHLNDNPLCVECKKHDHIRKANEVHHIVPIAAGGTHDPGNLMSLCRPCHSAITIREQGMNKDIKRAI